VRGKSEKMNDVPNNWFCDDSCRSELIYVGDDIWYCPIHHKKAIGDNCE